MARGILLMGALLVTGGALATPTVIFDGTAYDLAQVTAGATDVSNRYSPVNADAAGQPALTVREFPGATSTADVIARCTSALKGYLLDAPLALERSEHGDDVVLLMYRKTAEAHLVEYILERFVRTPTGVRSYRFTQRIHADADLRPVLMRQPGRIAELFGLNLPVRQAM
ncbi:MAG: hypothetical protein M0R77_10760 [Gammaproteobacteria bacterium]|nr:hypothetical protein [Gammaproteobacteria bacterium]